MRLSAPSTSVLRSDRNDFCYSGTETNATKLIPVKRYIIHPKYDSKIFLNDIAVIEVKQKMIFSNEVGPACLPFQHSPDTFGGSYVDILGK